MKHQLPFPESSSWAGPSPGAYGPQYIISVILTVAMTGRYHYSHFTEEETEAQKGENGMKGRSQCLSWQPLPPKSSHGGHSHPRPVLTSNTIFYQNSQLSGLSLAAMPKLELLTKVSGLIQPLGMGSFMLRVGACRNQALSFPELSRHNDSQLLRPGLPCHHRNYTNSCCLSGKGLDVIFLICVISELQFSHL